MLKIRLSTGKDPDDWMTIIKMEKREGERQGKRNLENKQGKKTNKEKGGRKTNQKNIG